MEIVGFPNCADNSVLEETVRGFSKRLGLKLKHGMFNP